MGYVNFGKDLQETFQMDVDAYVSHLPVSGNTL